jgi:hypothetical protein
VLGGAGQVPADYFHSGEWRGRAGSAVLRRIGKHGWCGASRLSDGTDQAGLCAGALAGLA